MSGGRAQTNASRVPGGLLLLWLLPSYLGGQRIARVDPSGDEGAMSGNRDLPTYAQGSVACMRKAHEGIC
jgi:hypothetical protein